MKLVIFGLSLSSSWGNGHATLWRGLCQALIRRGHRVVFFERDVPYYAAHRDLHALPGGELILYPDWVNVTGVARRHLAGADVAIATSYCPDSVAATTLMLESDVELRVFYDLDTPITLDRVATGQPVPYLGPRGLQDYDLVLSYTGGTALRELQQRLGAAQVAPLYGSVDPSVHQPADPVDWYRADLSYLATYSDDRQDGVLRFFIEPARRLPERRFLIGGAQYPTAFPWTDNIHFVYHVPPADHPAFYCSSSMTLNVTRRTMAATGYCPSGRLFEAAACGIPVITDWWEGLDQFFDPGTEIIVVRDTDEAVAACELPEADLTRIGRAARERTLASHTADRRVDDLEAALTGATQPARAEA